MHVLRARHLIASAGLAGAFVLAAGGSAVASVQEGVVHVYDVNPGTTNMGSVVITGAIGDSGTDQSGVSANANKIVLSQGTFEVDTERDPKEIQRSEGKGECSELRCGALNDSSGQAFQRHRCLRGHQGHGDPYDLQRRGTPETVEREV